MTEPFPSYNVNERRRSRSFSGYLPPSPNISKPSIDYVVEEEGEDAELPLPVTRGRSASISSKNSGDSDSPHETPFVTRRSSSSMPIRITAIVEDKQFVITLRTRQTIEALARAIEEKYSEQYSDDFHCCLVLDEDANPIDFSELVGESLAPGSIVHAVSAEDSTADDQAAKGETALYQISQISQSSSEFDLPSVPSTSESLSSDTSSTITKQSENKGSVLDQEFKAVLRNHITLQYFKEFCVEEFSVENLLFWLDVETYRMCMVDNQVRLQLARRIYINYISLEAPLQINLGQDIRSNIQWPSLGVSAEVFDEAQSHVYAMMKRHSFRRFLKSPKYRALEIRIAQDPQAFMAANVSNISEAFGNALAKELEPILSRGHRLSVDQRDRTLTKSMTRYWEAAHSQPLTGSYFLDKNKLSALQKQRRIRREKKLNKFFGEKLDAEQLKLQHKDRLDETAVDSDDQHDSTKLSILTPITDESDHFSRQKRVEKLHNFFGDQLPRPELRQQKLVFPSVRDDASFEETRAAVLDELMSETRSSNHLSKEEKKKLTKTTKKLKDILGEPLPNVQVEPSKAGFATTREKGEKAYSRHSGSTLQRSKQFFESMFSSSTPSSFESAQSRSASLSAETAAAAASTIKSPKMKRAHSDTATKGFADSAGIPLAKDGGVDTSVSTGAVAGTAVSVDDRTSVYSDATDTSKGSIRSIRDANDVKQTKEYRRRKLAKLQEFLGERLSTKAAFEQTGVTLEDGSSSSIPKERESSAVPREKVLSAEEKKLQQKKMYKLGKMFGVMPPMELIIMPDDPWKEKQRKSIKSLEFFLDIADQDDSDLFDLVNAMKEFDEMENARNDPDEPAQTAEQRRQMRRTMNQKKVNKLTHFFGDPLHEHILLEQKILEEITSTLEEEVETEEEMKELKKEIEVLKQKIRSRATSQASVSTVPAQERAPSVVFNSTFYVMPHADE